MIRGLEARERVFLISLLGALALPEALLMAADAGFVGSERWRYLAYSYGALWKGLLENWRPNFAAQPVTMFATYGFLHAGPGHLLGNILGVLVFLPDTLRRAGIRGGGLVCVAALLLGAAAFVVLADTPRPMIGASGVVYGAAAAWIYWDRRDRRATRDRLWPVWAKLAVLLLSNLAGWWWLSGNLAWQTHLGGAVGGWLAAWALDRPGSVRTRSACDVG